MVGSWKNAGMASLVLVALSGWTAGDLQTPECLRGDGGKRNISVNSRSGRDKVTRVKLETRRCKVTMELTGDVRIAGDLSGFSSVPAGGKVEIDSRDGDRRRELTLTPAPSGFAYVYKVDGDRRAWDNEGKAWLSSIITLLVRHGGFGADERVEHLLSAKGVNAVFEEVALLESDYMQRLYLRKLLDKATLNGGAVKTFLNVAQREIQSDYELAEVLISVASRYKFTDETRAAFIEATTAIDSDYEQRRTLTAVLKKGGLSSADLGDVIEATSSLSSNYERGQILQLVSGTIDLSDSRLQQAYVKSASELTSDHETRQVLNVLLKRERLSAGALDAVLAIADRVRSDYEQAEILVQVVRRHDLSPAQRARVLRMTEKMGSDHERGRVASVLLKQLND